VTGYTCDECGRTLAVNEVLEHPVTRELLCPHCMSHVDPVEEHPLFEPRRFA